MLKLEFLKEIRGQDRLNGTIVFNLLCSDPNFCRAVYKDKDKPVNTKNCIIVVIVVTLQTLYNVEYIVEIFENPINLSKIAL